MKIELLQSREALEKELAAASPADLVAQQIHYMAGIRTLEHFLNFGANEEHARQMLGELRQNLELAQSAARKFPNCVLTLDE